MEFHHNVAKSVVRKALNFQRYSEDDKEKVIDQLGDLFQMSVRNLEMVKQNITWGFCTDRDAESPITFNQIRVPEKDCRVALQVLIYGIFTEITIYEMWANDGTTYVYVEGDDDTTNELCDCGDWDCDLCYDQDGLANFLLVGRKE